jgi:asparagine synthase (glutamine-hydrolysing)
VNKLPPAHALVFNTLNGEAKVWRYWQAPPPPKQSESALDLVTELERLLEEAVRRQMMADVPVGVLLSGGVDSSLVTALAVRAVGDVKTFTVRFPGFGGYDEAEHARLIATHFHTNHIEIDAEAADVGLLPVLARQFDEPMIDSSMVPMYLVSRVVRRHCTVALGGDGGDELFGGYPHYDRLLRFASGVSVTPRVFRKMISALAGELMPVGVRGRNWLQSLAADWSTDVPPVTNIFDPVTRRRLLKKNNHWSLTPDQDRMRVEYRGYDLLQRASRLDFDTYLSEDLLVKVDRASMLNSLEIRAPFLDVPVIEFAFGRVPSHLKATRHDRKILLKRLAQKILPPGFDRMRKQGFSIPLSAWLQSGPWRKFFFDVLLDSSTTWFDRRLVAELLQSERHSRTNAERLYGLLMFELWRREYRIELQS